MDSVWGYAEPFSHGTGPRTELAGVTLSPILE
jgi:hypothetical protein